MVEPAVADVIGPAVTTDDPYAAPDEKFRHRSQGRGGGVVHPGQTPFQFRDAAALGIDPGRIGLVGTQDRIGELTAHRGLQSLEELARILRQLVHCDAHAEAEFRVVLE